MITLVTMERLHLARLEKQRDVKIREIISKIKSTGVTGFISKKIIDNYREELDEIDTEIEKTKRFIEEDL